jgi:hypothetical protein
MLLFRSGSGPRAGPYPGSLRPLTGALRKISTAVGIIIPITRMAKISFVSSVRETVCDSNAAGSCIFA